MIIKNDSIREFINKHMVVDTRRYRKEDIEYREVFQDEIIIKDLPVPVDSDIEFVFEEFSNITNVHLISKYYYRVRDYDSMHKKLELIDFKVTNRNK